MAKKDPSVLDVLGAYASKQGKDFAMIFDLWLDWLIDNFSLDNVLAKKGDYAALFEEMQANNEAFHQAFTITATKTAREIECKGWHDAFGSLYEEKVKSGYKAASMGQFFTPPELCTLMADTMAATGGVAMDCACGSGRLLLALHAKIGQPSYYVAGDLDAISCKMCALNMMMHGMFGVVERRNALSMEFFNGYVVNEAMFPIPAYLPSIRRADERACGRAVAVGRAWVKSRRGSTEADVSETAPVCEVKPKQLSLFAD